MNKVKTEDAPTYDAKAADTTPGALTPGEQATLSIAKTILAKQIQRRPFSLSSPDLVRDYLRTQLQLLEHEEFWVIFLDNQHRAITQERMFRGTICGASVYPREVAKRCLQLNAAAVIFAHNHPSGVATPSQADKTITSKLKEALALFDIRVLDHFIIAEETYSFSEHGLI